MQFNITHHSKLYSGNFAEPIKISIPLKHGVENPKCFHAADPNFAPVEAGDFIGDTRQGNAVNFYNVQFNPHGNGTHTECLGHITQDRYFIHNCLKQYHHLAQLITIAPIQIEHDNVITKADLEVHFKNEFKVNTIVIRTLPNSEQKLTYNYTNTNPPYIAVDAIEYLVEQGVAHLLIDLPSVDREEDGGQLLGHKAFWQVNGANNRKQCTITEMIYVPDNILDGLYLVNIQIMPIELDASSSNVVLYKLNKNESEMFDSLNLQVFVDVTS